MNRRVFLETVPFLGTAIHCSPRLLRGGGLPGQVNAWTREGNNRLPPSLAPEVIAWFWADKPEFEPGGYRKFIDMVAGHSNFGMLTTSLRAPQHEITFPETHDQIKRAVQYAHQRGLKIAFDLDVRLARGTFRNRFPDQLQWMLRIRLFPFSSNGGVQAEIKSQDLADHMTWPGSEYKRRSGQLMGVYRSAHDETQASPTLEEMRGGYRLVEESPERVSLEVPAGWHASGENLIVAAAFEYEYPDVFSPVLAEFHKGICEQYGDTSLDGGMGADEWGFPPVFNHGGADGDFWYSKAFADRYGKSGGGDFVRDCILMALGIGGSYEQRLIAINHYMRLILTRNTELEQAFYRNSTEVFGPQSFAGSHATWGFMPWGDAFKNGYDWWGATRDYGQTDEHWPMPVRTALGKKMGKAIWYNQFYAPEAEPYSSEIWQDARAGGRVNVHPLWPSSAGEDAYWAIFKSPFLRAENRVRLLNFIAKAPVDCPVAVVFGHATALNWAGPHFGDLGEAFAGQLWDEHGVRADLIPSSEIEAGALKLTADGRLAYGVQHYSVLVFLNPDFEGPETFEFLRRVARSKTYVFISDETGLAPGGVRRGDAESRVPGAGLGPTPAKVAEYLQSWSGPRRRSPSDLVRFTDGTYLLARGEKNPAGDRFDETFYCEHRSGLAKVRAGATGVFAIRLGDAGEVQALAASDLRTVQVWDIVPFKQPTERFHLELQAPVDLALWRDANGKPQGVIQGASAVPHELLQWTRDWIRLDMAPPRTRAE